MRALKYIITVILLTSTAYAQLQTTVRFVSATPTISNGVAYAAGDSIGGLMTFTGACLSGSLQAEIRGVTLWDLTKQGADIDVLVFSANPTGTTFTDNAALDVADADLAKIAAVVQITSDSAYSDNGISQAKNLSYEIACTSTGTFYAAMVSRGTPTYGSTTELTLQFEIYTR